MSTEENCTYFRHFTPGLDTEIFEYKTQKGEFLHELSHVVVIIMCRYDFCPPGQSAVVWLLWKEGDQNRFPPVSPQHKPSEDNWRRWIEPFWWKVDLPAWLEICWNVKLDLSWSFKWSGTTQPRLILNWSPADLVLDELQQKILEWGRVVKSVIVRSIKKKRLIKKGRPRMMTITNEGEFSQWWPQCRSSTAVVLSRSQQSSASRRPPSPSSAWPSWSWARSASSAPARGMAGGGTTSSNQAACSSPSQVGFAQSVAWRLRPPPDLIVYEWRDDWESKRGTVLCSTSLSFILFYASQSTGLTVKLISLCDK